MAIHMSKKRRDELCDALDYLHSKNQERGQMMTSKEKCIAAAEHTIHYTKEKTATSRELYSLIELG